MALWLSLLYSSELKSSHFIVGEASVLEPPGEMRRLLHTIEYPLVSPESTAFSTGGASIQGPVLPAVGAPVELSSCSLSLEDSRSSVYAGGLGRGDQGRPVVIFLGYELLLLQPAAMEAKAESG